jgi:ribosomal protein S18 acetylase RimI-like enzyme
VLVASRTVAVPEHVVRFWRALDDLVANVRPTPWGAVVTDPRSPAIWDTNYARVDRPVAVGADEIERDLLPALSAVGAPVEHVLTFHHEVHASLLAELSARGHRIGWDLLLDLPGPPSVIGSAAVEELEAGEELWSRFVASLALFGVEPPDAVAQLVALELDVLGPGGKRWFGVRDGRGEIVSLGALLVLEGVGYVDNVATFPEARGRGYASAVTAEIAMRARSAGADRTILLADPDDGAVVRMYERLGFRPAGRLASTRGPLP